MTLVFVIPSKPTEASTPTAQEMALAILAQSNQSALQSALYTDSDPTLHRQAIILTNFGTITPSDGPNFLLLSTGIAGNNPVMTESGLDGYHTERGKWFGPQHPSQSGPFDHATLTLTLKVPQHMHYFYYDAQFFTTEYPDYCSAGTTYNDKLTVTVKSPHCGTTVYTKQVKDGDFVLTADDIPGTGFDIFAKIFLVQDSTSLQKQVHLRTFLQTPLRWIGLIRFQVCIREKRVLMPVHLHLLADSIQCGRMKPSR
ncbi:MAG: hypothetical protein NTX92_09190, partial [Euryarchaeota archaeon]|nr:hypothetical protein [Euryarchaeota archaeon]